MTKTVHSQLLHQCTFMWQFAILDRSFQSGFLCFAKNKCSFMVTVHALEPKISLQHYLILCDFSMWHTVQYISKSLNTNMLTYEYLHAHWNKDRCHVRNFAICVLMKSGTKSAYNYLRHREWRDGLWVTASPVIPSGSHTNKHGCMQKRGGADGTAGCMMNDMREVGLF